MCQQRWGIKIWCLEGSSADNMRREYLPRDLFTKSVQLEKHQYKVVQSDILTYCVWMDAKTVMISGPVTKSERSCLTEKFCEVRQSSVQEIDIQHIQIEKSWEPNEITSSNGFLLDSGTSAERMRRYRLKKKEEDPKYGQKESQRIASLIKQKRENLTGMEKREFNKKNRDAVAKWRAKKKEENKTATSTGFKSPQKLWESKEALAGHTTTFAYKAEATDSWSGSIRLLNLKSKTEAALKEPDDTKTAIQNFFFREDISYTAPGMNDEMTVWEDGKKK
ncbi:hypothetical protein RRG08_008010 [Elysia crispata]|uniref:Uncharacterized protein n=1 Tax=Elysia crispata TaxID=231223 RepID=A0AAE1D3A6_9GAST|nr:hypothetical protein RRG08_008010 [Elysia crispata]